MSNELINKWIIKWTEFKRLLKKNMNFNLQLKVKELLKTNKIELEIVKKWSEVNINNYN